MNKKIVALSNYPLISGISLIVALIIIISGCNSGRKDNQATVQKNPKCNVEKSLFGMTPEGDSALLIPMTNEQGIVVKITNYGGIITEIHTPDRDGKMGNIGGTGVACALVVGFFPEGNN